jgi:hypothetical protein
MVFRKANGTASLAAEQQALAVTNDQIAELSRSREQQLLAGDEEAIDRLDGELDMLERIAKRHGDRMGMLLDRVDPIVSRHDIEVTHRVIDPDTEALEELRALRQLGATREKLLELFGHNGLDRIETLDAADTARRGR